MDQHFPRFSQYMKKMEEIFYNFYNEILIDIWISHKKLIPYKHPHTRKYISSQQKKKENIFLKLRKISYHETTTTKSEKIY